jgi:hypothetical protein
MFYEGDYGSLLVSLVHEAARESEWIACGARDSVINFVGVATKDVADLVPIAHGWPI